ncbi:Serine/threonine-protein kinase HAL5 [Madurella mycetomatis]|uniref:non-specific serine/threonine protein kinase n=1 Tax=Madurella mycetomatis TaxID=100816 RepID=A0A175VWB2_9PEZI|nr:Serine/threonine-protein kinase HAL5 [Madurella mycetomatis]
MRSKADVVRYGDEQLVFYVNHALYACFGNKIDHQPDGPAQEWYMLVHGKTVLAKIRKTTKNDAVQHPLLPDQETRLRVLKYTFEAETSVLWNAEVLHGDLSPRNVMVQPDGSVVIIYFNQAVVYQFHYQPHPKYDEGAHPLPPSLIERY